jgi:beta-glucosidase
VQVRVTNTGDRAGSDVVQVYVHDDESSVHRPDKELQGFAKVHLAPGEDTVVQLRLDRRSFAVWDVEAHDWLVEAGRFQIVVARSSIDVAAVLDHDVASTDRVHAVEAPTSWVATREEFERLLGGPVPPVPPMRPFHRNSTLEEIESTALGRLVAAQIVREGLKRSAAEFPDPDDATLEMVRSSLREGPARMLVQMSDGMVSFDVLDPALEALDGRWSAAARRGWHGMRKRSASPGPPNDRP